MRFTAYKIYFFNVVYIPGNVICLHKQLLMEGYVCAVCYLGCKLASSVCQAAVNIVLHRLYYAISISE